MVLLEVEELFKDKKKQIKSIWTYMKISNQFSDKVRTIVILILKKIITNKSFLSLIYEENFH